MNYNAKPLLSIILTTCLAGGLSAEPQFATGSLTKLESMKVAVATTAFVPDFEADEKFKSEDWASNRGFFDIKPYVKIAWLEIHAFRGATEKLSMPWATELKAEFDKAVWKEDQPELDKSVGFAAPEAVYVFPDADSQDGHWILKVWKGTAEISVAFECGGNLFQERPDSKSAVITNQRLIEAILKTAFENSKEE